MNKLFDRTLDRRALHAEKWKGIPEDTIAMSIADMDFPVKLLRTQENSAMWS